jgi:ATP-binding cassette subfamily B protein
LPLIFTPLSAEKTGNSVDFKLIVRILRFAKPYKGLFWGSALFILLSSVIAPIRPYLIQFAFDHYVLEPNLQMLFVITLVMIGLLLAETLIQFFVSFMTNRLGQSVIKDIRVKIFSHIAGFKLKYYDNTPIGTIVTRTVNDIETISSVFSEGVLQIAGDFLKIFAILAVMIYTDPVLTLVTLVPVPILIFSTNIFKNGIKKTFQAVRNKVADLNTFVQEHITGMSIVQVFNREETEYRKFLKINADHRIAHIKSIWYYSVFFPIVEVITAISIGLVVYWAADDIIQSSGSSASPGIIISFILYIYMLYRPVRQLADRFNTLQMGVVSGERVFKILDSDESIKDTGTLELKDLKGSIRFRNVWFAYNEGDYVLKNVSFEVKPGEKLALVGSTGSGKTSIINTITRFYEIEKGAIEIDGIDIRNISINNLQSQISTVLQDVFLFSESILNNIRLNDTSISEEEVVEAAKFVGAHDFIMRLPGGYHFNVRERGAMLSVGQRQLISFIRAYVNKPKILILDEATSSIDTESEQLIQIATEKLTQGRTSIIIAHRLSTIRQADKIIVLDKGEIVESGSHVELIALNARYKKLFELQYS